MRSLSSVRRWCFALAAAALLVLPMASQSVHAETSTEECFSQDWGRRIQGCTDIIDSSQSTPLEKSQAYAMRALALSLRGQFEDSIGDYDQAIRINPNFAVALNNRAWAYYKWGKGPRGLADVERSLTLNPLSEHTWDTRAHIRQVMGNFAGAYSDYEQAVNIGGERMIKLYQCGLAAQGLYKGRLDGYNSDELQSALKTCAYSKTCDPLPSDEECRDPTS